MLNGSSILLPKSSVFSHCRVSFMLFLFWCINSVLSLASLGMFDMLSKSYSVIFVFLHFIYFEALSLAVKTIWIVMSTLDHNMSAGTSWVTFQLVWCWYTCPSGLVWRPFSVLFSQPSYVFILTSLPRRASRWVLDTVTVIILSIKNWHKQQVYKQVYKSRVTLEQ